MAILISVEVMVNTINLMLHSISTTEIKNKHFGNLGLGSNKYYNELNLNREQDRAIYDQRQSGQFQPAVECKNWAFFFAMKTYYWHFAKWQRTDNDREFLSTSITKIYSQQSPGKVDSTLDASNNIRTQSLNANVNLNYRFTDTLGNELSVDVDRGMHLLLQPACNPIGISMEPLVR